ncbi:MAG: hypothetical protein CMD83_13265 [Gammaproteobacteria bacterium]|nr:hypothetical protein [Gammaproteobacteria bacterium]
MVRENDGDPVPAGQAFRIGLADDDVSLGVGESALLIWVGTGQTDSSAEIFVDASDIFGGFLPHDMTIGITSGTDGYLFTNNPGGAVVFTNRRGFTTVRVGLDNPANTPPSGALLTASTGSTVAGEQSSIRQIFCSH